MVIPLPSELILPLAGWKLVFDRGLSAWWLLLAGFAGAAGSLAAAIGYYYLGAWGGRPFLERYGRYVLISKGDLDQSDRWFAARGELTVFLTRMIPLVRTFISIPAGVSRMNIWKFSLYTFLGSFVWSYALAWGGYALGENYEQLRTWMSPADIPILVVLVALGTWYLWHKVRLIRRENAASKARSR